MDNQAFEMQGDHQHIPSYPAFPNGKQRPNSEGAADGHGGGSWLLRVFLVCLLAGVLTTALGVLSLSLVIVTDSPTVTLPAPPPPMGDDDSNGKDDVDVKFQFLYHLSKSKVHTYPGGEIQWGRFRQDPSEYSSAEERAFGDSINARRSQITFGTLRIRPGGLRAPHWHFNANEHGYLLQGSAWIGIIGPDDAVLTTYNVSAGQVVFFPRNTVHWVKNVGDQDCLFLLFFSTHRELLTLDVDDAFFGTPEDVLARALQPEGGVNFIRTFQKQSEDQAINLPPNLEQLVHNATYTQSPDHMVWQFFYDLKGSQEFPFPGGIFQWARYRLNGTGLTPNQQIFSESLHKHENTLTLATLRIFGNSLGRPHFHFNAHEMGYVLSGCGQAGVILSGTTSTFPIGIGDLLFFPVGTQHFLLSTCQEDLVVLLAYSTNSQLETLGMRRYFHGTADHILAQLFFKEQSEFQKFPKDPQ